jgi:hypothetical protein
MNIVYKTHKLSLEQKKNLLLDCKEKCYKWWVDILDCSVSAARQKVDMSFDEMLQKLNKKSFFTVIDRGTFYNWDTKHFEIGFSTITENPEYFLFILVKDEDFKDLKFKYGLKSES